MKHFVNGLRNIWTFRKVVWRFWWWDFGFQEEMIDKMLEECEKQWSNSHYIGWEFTLGRIKVVRRYYSEYRNTSDIFEEDRLQRKFLKAYARLLPRLWD